MFVPALKFCCGPAVSNGQEHFAANVAQELAKKGRASLIGYVPVISGDWRLVLTFAQWRTARGARSCRQVANWLGSSDHEIIRPISASNAVSFFCSLLCERIRNEHKRPRRIGLFCSRFRKNLWIIYLEPPQKTKRCVSRVTRRANALRGNKICGVLNRLTRRACTRSLDQR